MKGVFPRLLTDILKDEGYMPAMEQDDLEVIKENTVDLLGINYYQPRRVKAKNICRIQMRLLCLSVSLTIMKCGQKNEPPPRMGDL